MKNRFICAEEVAQELSVSKPYAYKLIRKLNEELKAKGFITISGRVNRQYFYERLYGAGNPQGDTTMTYKAGQMKQAHGITERLKAENQMEWVARMNNLQSCAREIVDKEMIYQ